MNDNSRLISYDNSHHAGIENTENRSIPNRQISFSMLAGSVDQSQNNRKRVPQVNLEKQRELSSCFGFEKQGEDGSLSNQIRSGLKKMGSAIDSSSKKK